MIRKYLFWYQTFTNLRCVYLQF